MVVVVLKRMARAYTRVHHLKMVDVAVITVVVLAVVEEDAMAAVQVVVVIQAVALVQEELPVAVAVRSV